MNYCDIYNNRNVYCKALATWVKVANERLTTRNAFNVSAMPLMTIRSITHMLTLGSALELHNRCYFIQIIDRDFNCQKTKKQIKSRIVQSVTKISSPSIPYAYNRKADVAVKKVIQITQ